MSHLIKPIPLLDNLGTPIFIGLFLLLFWLQSQRPLRRRHFSALQRMVRNFAFSTPGFAAMRLAMVPIPLTVAAWAEDQGIGLFHWLGVSGWAAAILGFVFMDWAYYWWHYLNHTLPFFWRFHNVHHTDLDLDVSTAARFHFGEIILSVPFRVLVVALLGIPFRALLIFEIIFESATMFHHSNWRLPLGLERALNHVIVTPRMHGIHHSIVEKETNSNWGTIFCWWDGLHRTLRRDISQDEITIGVAAYRNERELTLANLWTLPFRKQREWRLPNGEVPTREERPARSLQP
jgi:sterol desaturase/sphingolipid hydroxylase (fatty acid hydroxylase superfamily)